MTYRNKISQLPISFDEITILLLSQAEKCGDPFGSSISFSPWLQSLMSKPWQDLSGFSSLITPSVSAGIQAKMVVFSQNKIRVKGRSKEESAGTSRTKPQISDSESGPMEKWGQPLICQVTLEKLANLLDPQFPHLWNGDGKTCLARWLWRLEITCAKCLV